MNVRFSKLFPESATYKLHFRGFISIFALNKNAMKFIRGLEGYDHLWSVKENEDGDALSLLFKDWNDANFLLDFFKENIEDLKNYFHIEKISQAISDTFEDADALEELILEFPSTENLDNLFRPLSQTDAIKTELTRNKARNWNNQRHPSWLRIYAIRLEPNVYIVTGGAIKLTATMQERKHTEEQLEKLNKCRDFLIENGVFDKDSFVDFTKED